MLLKHYLDLQVQRKESEVTLFCLISWHMNICKTLNKIMTILQEYYTKGVQLVIRYINARLSPKANN